MSGSYLVPANVPVSDTWQGHKNRNPPSPEPGTDYATAYGSAVAMAYDGTISVIDTSPYGGEGRRMSVDLSDGRRVSYLHLSQVTASVGQRVKRGQTGLCLSGASGNGSDWYYGPHVHVSLWERPGMAYAATIDFQKYVGNPPAPTPPSGGDEDEEMAMKGGYYTRSSDGQVVNFLFNEVSGFWSEHLGGSGAYNNNIAKNWETNSWVSLSESHVRALKAQLDNVRRPSTVQVDITDIPNVTRDAEQQQRDAAAEGADSE